MLPTQKGGSHSHGGHGHSHGHGNEGGHGQGISQLMTPANLIHFSTVAFSTILYYILFAWETLFINFIFLFIWSCITTIIVANVLRIPRSAWAQFGSRFVFLSFVFYFVIR
jgi:hypothetical protein